MTDTRDYRILPGTGIATVATLCDYYKERKGGIVVAKKLGVPPCEYHETNKHFGHCTYFLCPMCTYLQTKQKDEKS